MTQYPSLTKSQPTMSVETETDRYLARQAAHQPHDSCRGAGDIDYHQPEDYLDPIYEEATDTN